jgi:O-antigen ligase
MFFNHSPIQKKQIHKKSDYPLDLNFFYLFLLTFSLGIRKVVWFFPIKSLFNEYNGIYIYLSDLFLFFTVLSWIISILKNKNHYLSTKTTPASSQWQKRNKLLKISVFFIPLILFCWSLLSIFWSENKIISFYRSIKLFESYTLFLYATLRFFPHCWHHIKKTLTPVNTLNNSINSKRNENKIVSRETILSEIHLHLRAMLLGFLFIGLFDHYLWDIWQGQVLLWLTIGLLFSSTIYGNSENIDFPLFKTLEEKTDNQALTIDDNQKKPFLSSFVFLNLFIFIGILQASIGIIQFIKQGSLGLFWLKESLINEKIAGVAKIIVNHRPLIRAYGLFPHPNIFAGFLFFIIMFTILYKNLFHVKQINQKAIFADKYPLESSDSLNKSTRFVSRETNNKNNPTTFISKFFLIDTILAIEALALILSFSKSGIIALLIAICYINVSRETSLEEYKNIALTKIKHSKYFLIFTLASSGAFFFILYFFKIDFYALFIKSLYERGLYFSISKQTITNNPFFGIGEGQFIINAAKTFPNLAVWQYQPVHNIFLLIWSEWGIVGLVLFILFLYKLFYTDPINKKINDPRAKNAKI